MTETGTLRDALHDTSRDPHPEPCGDCGRSYIQGEHVEWRVPAPEPDALRLVWSGCVDCFLRRTHPGAVVSRES